MKLVFGWTIQHFSFRYFASNHTPTRHTAPHRASLQPLVLLGQNKFERWKWGTGITEFINLPTYLICSKLTPYLRIVPVSVTLQLHPHGFPSLFKPHRLNTRYIPLDLPLFKGKRKEDDLPPKYTTRQAIPRPHSRCHVEQKFPPPQSRPQPTS